MRCGCAAGWAFGGRVLTAIARPGRTHHCLFGAPGHGLGVPRQVNIRTSISISSCGGVECRHHHPTKDQMVRAPRSPPLGRFSAAAAGALGRAKSSGGGSGVRTAGAGGCPSRRQQCPVSDALCHYYSSSTGCVKGEPATRLGCRSAPLCAQRSATARLAALNATTSRPAAPGRLLSTAQAYCPAAGNRESVAGGPPGAVVSQRRDWAVDRRTSALVTLETPVLLRCPPPPYASALAAAADRTSVLSGCWQP